MHGTLSFIYYFQTLDKKKECISTSMLTGIFNPYVDINSSPALFWLARVYISRFAIHYRT